MGAGGSSHRTSSAVRVARRVVLAAFVLVAVFATSASADNTVTFTASQTLPVPPASNFAGAGGGDGWAVALTPKAVYNVFHHASTMQVACHLQASESNAAGCWGKDQFGRDLARTITQTSGDSTFNFSTSGHPGLWLDQDSGHLYVFSTRSDGTGGVVCIDTVAADTSTNPFCGFTPLTAAGEAAGANGTSGIGDPAVVGNRWFAFNYFSGTGIGGPNGGGAQNKLLCFDLTTFAACAGQPFVVTLGDGAVSVSTFPAPSLAAIGSQVVISANVGGRDELACADGSAPAVGNCGGAWPVVLESRYSSVNGAPFPLLSASGAVTGVCLPTGTDPCFSLAGADVATPENMTAAIPGTSGWNGAAVQIGPRVYVPNGNANEVDCYDYNLSSSCPSFPKHLNGLSLLYTVNADPARPTCLWVNSDNGGSQIQNFDAFTGGACGQGPIRVLASTFVVTAPKCTPGSYTSLQVTDPVRSSYTSGTVTFADGSGNPIPNVPDVQLDASGTATLTGLNLNTQSGLPQFLITLNGAGDTPKSVTVQLTWTGTFDPDCEKPATVVVNPPAGVSTGAPAVSDVSVSVAGPASVRIGSDVTFTVTAKNSGINTSTGVELRIPVPAGSTLVSAKLSNGNSCATGSVVTCFVGTLAPGGSAIATIVVTPTQAGPLTESASVQGDYDSNPANNGSSASTTVLSQNAPPLPPPPPTQPGTFNAITTGIVLVNGVAVTADKIFQIKSGDIIDVTQGSITFTAADGSYGLFSGTQPTARVSTRLHALGATGTVVSQFQIGPQATADTPTELDLVGGDFSVCTSKRSLSAGNQAPVRALWGSAKGHFTTKARYSAATIRGTIWLTEDRCDGSLTQVVQSVVDVADFTTGKTIAVNPGESYLALPKTAAFKPPTTKKKPHKAKQPKPATRPAVKAKPTTQLVYQVRAGDSLWTIAAAKLHAGKRWAEIASLNKLRPPYAIPPGTKLKLPRH